MYIQATKITTLWCCGGVHKKKIMCHNQKGEFLIEHWDLN